MLLTGCLSAPVWSQAVVNESLETASLYVDALNGSDSNPGTQQQPLKTIGAAATQAIANKKSAIGTKVIINPGLYRENIVLKGSGLQSSLPMTFEAAAPGQVFVSGAVQYSKWNKYAGNNSIYTSPWNNDWGFCKADQGGGPYEQKIVLRQEMIFVNGTQMTQVLSLNSMLYPGTFFVDESAGLVYVWPPSGTNMGEADVEVATNAPIFRIWAPNLLVNAIVIRGITFEYANPCHHDAATTVSGNVSNVIFDNDTFIWNNGQGLAINGTANGITVSNSTANHNGSAGFQAFQAKNVLWQNDTASYNNWRGALGAYYEWNTAGFHIFSDHDETLSGITATYNQTKSIHWDTDNQNVTASGILASQNYLGGVIEKNEGPVTISNSTFCSARIQSPGYGGMTVRDSENVTLSGDTFYTNSNSQIYITGILGGYQVTNWETGKVYNLVNSNLTMTGNLFEGTPGQLLFQDSSLGGSEWTSFVTSLKSDNNTWWNATNTGVFTEPVPVNGTVLDFPGWQLTTGQDTNSTWGAPAKDPSPLCAVTAEGPDYWLMSDIGVNTTGGAGTATYTLSTVALGGINDTVTLAADVSSIQGASVSFSPSSIGTSDSSILTFQAGLNTPAGTYNFTVLGSTGAITRAVTLQATVPTSFVRLSTDSLAFGDEPVGGTSPGQAVILTNVGNSPLSMNSVKAGYGFTQQNDCGNSVAAGQSCMITVTFAPPKLIAYGSSLTINTSDPASPHSVLLSGTAVGAGAASLSPKSLSLGSIAFGDTSPAKTTTLTNTGTAALNISSIAITGANPGDFSQNNNCGNSLAAGANCVITATFSPTAIGSRNASITVTDDATGSPQSVSLSGTGKTALSLSPKSAGFGSVKLGGTATKTVTVTNNSTSAVPFGSITFTGVNANDYSETDNCLPSLAGNARCTITMIFAPTFVGDSSATLNIADADPTSPQTVSLSGTGLAVPGVLLAPSSLSFGDQVYKTASAPMAIILTNTGNTNLSITRVSITGTNKADFSQTNSCTGTLAPTTAATYPSCLLPAR